jgi:hypothetical protein
MRANQNSSIVLVVVLLTACAGSDVRPASVAPSSEPFDAATEIVEIPDGACPLAPKLEGMVAFSERALIAVEQDIRQKAKACRVKTAALEERCEVCEAQLAEANKHMAAREWLWRWGPLIGVGGAAAAFAAGIVAGWAAAK